MEKNNQTFNKKNKKKLIGNLIFLGLTTILIIVLLFSLGEIGEIFSTISKVSESNNWVYLLIAILLTLIYFALWPLSLCIFARGADKTIKFSDSYLIGCSEHFYNGVTPFATGGQPFQVYSYTKKGVSSSKATGLVLANFTTFMFVTNLIALISLLFWNRITGNFSALNNGSDISWFKWVAVAGFVINFLVFLFMICLGTSKKIRKGIIGIVKFFGKIKFLKNIVDKSLPSLEEYCENAQTSFKEIARDIPTFVKAFIVKLITMLIYYSIPFFLLLSLGFNLEPIDIVFVLFGTSFAITSVVFMPTPGGSGGIEYAFSIVIASLATNFIGQAQAVTLLWRLCTFYVLILVSFITSIVYEKKVNNYLNKLEENEGLENGKN